MTAVLRDSATSPVRTRRNVVVLRIALAVLVVVGAGAAPTASLRQSAGLSLITLVVALIGCARHSPAGVLRPVCCYAAVLALFHLGLVPYLLFGVQPPDFGASLNVETLRSIYLPFAITMAGAAIGAVSLGGMLADVWMKRPPRRVSQLLRHSERIRTLWVGSVSLWTGVALWSSIGLDRLGVAFVTRPYPVWREATADATLLPYAYFLIGVGFVFVVLACQRFVSIVTSPFWVFAVGGLALGLRNEVLVPFVAAISMRAVLGWRPRVVPALAALALALVVIGGIRVTRQDGLEAGGPTPSPRLAAEALAEMGYSVRTVSLVQEWHVEGDRLLYGRTYWAPLERLLANVVADLDAPPVREDPRASETLVRARVGPIGFSSIAEATRNFSVPGALAVLGLQGALLAGLEWRAGAWRAALFLSVVLIAFLLHARNSFTPIPFQLTFGGAMTLLACPPRLRA